MNPKEPKEQIVNVNDDHGDELLHLKELQIFRNICNKRLDKIEDLTKKLDGNNLIFTTISTAKTIDFSKKDDPLTFLNKIKKGEITVEEAKESQKYFDKYLKYHERRIKITSKRKHWQILICFLMEEINQLISSMAMVQ